jgi:hypothetical protein
MPTVSSRGFELKRLRCSYALVVPTYPWQSNTSSIQSPARGYIRL